MPPPETPGHSQASLPHSLLGSLLLSLGSWCTQGFVHVLQESLSPILCKFCNQIPVALVFSVPLPDPQVGESVVGPGMFATVGELLWYNCSAEVDCQDGRVKVHPSSPVRTPKLQLAAERLLTGECWIPPKKISYIQGQRRSPNKMVGVAKSLLESNPISSKESQRVQTKPCVPQTPQETESHLPLSVWVSPEEARITSGRCRDRGSGCDRPGRRSCNVNPLGRDHH